MTSLFSAASAPTQLIGRYNEMECIREAIYAAGSELRVVCLVGDGGIGKTRMLNEVKLAIKGQRVPPARVDLDWTAYKQSVVVSDVLDLEPVRLSTTLRFVNDLVNALDPEQEFFRRFREEHAKHRQALVFQSSYHQIQSMLHAALSAFDQDYVELAANRRIVILLDTGEKFAVPIPPEFDRMAEVILAGSMHEENRAADTPIYTVQWLRRWLTIYNEQSLLQNTTIIMAGRPQGNWWDIFAGITETKLKRVNLGSLTQEEIPAYLAQLTTDLHNVDRFPPSREVDYTVRRLERYAAPDAAWTLWALTRGRPVLVALTADLLIDGMIEPPQLDQDRFALQEMFGWDPQTDCFTAEDTLAEAQRSLSDQFVEILFNSSADVRAIILSLLVRAHHPLDAETLEYLIYGVPGEHYWEWIQARRSSPDRLQEIETELEWLRHLAFFKYRIVAPGSGGRSQLQVFLQDVMYEIFDDYFVTVNEASRIAEIQHRTDIYLKLIEVLNKRIEDCEQGLRDTWLDERWGLETELRPQSLYAPQGLQALRARFPQLSEMPLIRRSPLTREELRDRLEEHLLERLYYSLRINPKRAVNNDYSQLADGAWLEHDEDFMTQIEVQVWRLLKDKSAQKLVELSLDPPLKSDDPMLGDPDRYDPWKRLERVVLQDHALRWLKRLHLRERYDEVVKMAIAIRHYALSLPIDPQLDDSVRPSSNRHSWNHTLTIQETFVYEGYAYPYIGKTAAAIETLEGVVRQLNDVLSKGHAGRQEAAFVHSNGKDHLATERVRRAIGIAQFVLGYSHAANGDFAKAQDAYNKALPQLRRTHFLSLEVYCRFNMARALAELGYTMEAAKNCEDALNLLTNDGKGGTLPFALASNTLALVYNAERALDAAWLNAAVAHACFVRMAEERGTALAELQFGEALRRMADKQHRQDYSPDRNTPRHVYQESERVLTAAYNRICMSPTLNREAQRRAEAAIELASSLRDQVRVLELPQEQESARLVLRRAHGLFVEAESVAVSISHAPLQLDARWGLATLLYRSSRTEVGQYAKDQLGPIPLDTMVQAFNSVADLARELELITQQAWISTENEHPSLGDSKVRAIRRLGRVYSRLGRVYAEEFSARNLKLRNTYGLLPYAMAENDARRRVQSLVLEDSIAARYLQEAANHYVIALAYARLYNPKAKLSEYILGDVFDRAKGFNDTVMGSFIVDLKRAEAAYHVQSLAGALTESLEAFLTRSFGDYHAPDPHVN